MGTLSSTHTAWQNQFLTHNGREPESFSSERLTQKHILPATAGRSHPYWWSWDRPGETGRGAGGVIRSSFNQKCEPQHQISIWWVKAINQTFTHQLWSQRAQGPVEKNTVHMYILEMYHLLMKVFLFLVGPSRTLRQNTLMIFPFQLSSSVFVTWAQHSVPELIASPIRESDLNQLASSRYWRKHET